MAAAVLVVFPVLAGCPGVGEMESDVAGAFTVRFDGAEGTTSGTTDFSHEGASFSGGTVRTLGQPALYGSGLFGYEVLAGSLVTIVFDNPVDVLAAFLATRNGGQITLTALDADGNAVGTLGGSTGSGAQTVTLSEPALRVEVAYAGDGDGWLDDVTFGFAAASSP